MELLHAIADDRTLRFTDASVLEFDLSPLLQEVISRDFPNLETSVSVSFFKAVLSQTQTLANVVFGDAECKNSHS